MYYQGMSCDDRLASLEEGVAASSFMGFFGKVKPKPKPKPVKAPKKTKSSGMVSHSCAGTGYSINCDTTSPLSCDQQCQQYINNAQAVITPAPTSSTAVPVNNTPVNPNQAFSDQVQSGVQVGGSDALTVYNTTPKVVTPQVLPGSMPVQPVSAYTNPAQSGSNYYIPATPAYNTPAPAYQPGGAAYIPPVMTAQNYSNLPGAAPPAQLYAFGTGAPIPGIKQMPTIDPKLLSGLGDFSNPVLIGIAILAAWYFFRKK